MRSSKSRSRNKSNRQRSIGNIINRVFDSSGPEGKVRGTPQQIIDKYLMLARDAQLSNDRVAEQNFLQHAEHYTRMLGEAQREMAREQEERQRQNQQNGHGQRERGENRSDDQPREDQPEPQPAAAPEPQEQPDEGSTLVETPEMRAEAVIAAAPPAAEGKPAKPRNRRAPRKPREPKGEDAPTPEAPSEAPIEE
ncbi:DUF4167 domain-containing protein [Sedimentimonas flavescens]|uniref:DUF4167 domain-containing protein n=1 Tax=Sedimentimonas flavescens TaxID=2851012 RepID=UPI001C4A561C|nr:DUF4167 domain-containing protein [Sedimentimonas flavescens]MBW0157866.1 DUF4167 domain-containing protein [Sedimentimonas flavescens]